MTKKELKSMVAHAYEVQSQTVRTQVVFQVYADGHYILDTEEDNVIEVMESEDDAIQMCEAKELKGCYYKPILIDADSGERITRQNFDSYKK